MVGQPGFFDVDERLKRLSDLGDQLLAFAAAVDFEVFRAELTRALAYSDGSQGGRPPFDPVTMFKVLVIQTANNLADERTEFLINDRLSFMRFLGLSLSDRVPDARTIWLFREKLTRAGAIKPLFDRFDAALRQAGYLAMGGQIIDATLVAAPRQRNTQEEKTAIRQGRIPEDWKAKPAKLRQKDRDARWTVKFSKAKERRRRLEAGRRHRYPDVRLSEPRLDRPPIRPDPPLGRDRRRSLRGRAAARGPARQDQHRERGMGGHGLSVEGQ
jgi:transposase, IS5 family